VSDLDRRAAGARAQRLAFRHLLQFVRQAKLMGWDPQAFVPRVAGPHIADAISQATVYETLCGDAFDDELLEGHR